MDTAQHKRQAAEAAVEFVEDGQIVGLGTGSTAEHAIRGLARRVDQGLRITGVPTSTASADLADRLGIPIVDFNEVDAIDITIDGADEVDPSFNLIKGAGGAHTREKLVAQATRQQVIVVDRSKLVNVLGSNFSVPVEVVPFGWRIAQRGLAGLGGAVTLRGGAEHPFVTDNGNYVLNCRFDGIKDPAALEAAIKQLPAVIDSGLFIGLTHRLIVAGPDGVHVLDVVKAQRSRSGVAASWDEMLTTEQRV